MNTNQEPERAPVRITSEDDARAFGERGYNVREEQYAGERTWLVTAPRDPIPSQEVDDDNAPAYPTPWYIHNGRLYDATDTYILDLSDHLWGDTLAARIVEAVNTNPKEQA